MYSFILRERENLSRGGGEGEGEGERENPKLAPCCHLKARHGAQTLEP